MWNASPLLLAFSALVCTGFSLRPRQDNNLPVVDLGYELHRAASYDEATDIYTFTNIRYAQAPVGDLRFRAPLPPLPNRDTIQNGSGTRICPQGVPEWQARAFGPFVEYTSGRRNFSLAAWVADVANATAPPINFTAGNTEDCLFLDVHVQRTVLEAAQRCRATAPVLVWIHGGGYTFGSKAGGAVPTGLIEQARRLQTNDSSGSDGLVFVAINYRLGALGFLWGPATALQAGEAGGVPNAGLLDQRLALRWVQQHAHRFGGAAHEVTVLGESAGGGSVLLHMAAYGGRPGSAPFARAVVQSPGVAPTVAQPDWAEAAFLRELGVLTLDEARAPEEDVIRANAAVVARSPPNSYTYGPVVDGALVPGPLLNRTRFDEAVEVLAGHNSNEGAIFFDPEVDTEDEFRDWLHDWIPRLSDEAAEHIATVLYPPVFDGSLGYVDQASRQMAVWGESVVDCNFLLIAQANGGRNYAYEFSVPPGLHGQDLAYTFNNPASPPLSTEAQNVLQQAIASFAVTGVPRATIEGEERAFPMWGSEGALVNITLSGAYLSRSRVNETRCRWWKKGCF